MTFSEPGALPAKADGRILIVDDEPANVHLLQQMLQRLSRCPSMEEQHLTSICLRTIIWEL